MNLVGALVCGWLFAFQFYCVGCGGFWLVVCCVLVGLLWFLFWVGLRLAVMVVCFCYFLLVGGGFLV